MTHPHSPWPGLVRSGSVRTPPSGAQRQAKNISRGDAEARSRAVLRVSAPPREFSYWRAPARPLGGRVKPGHGEICNGVNSLKNSSPHPLTKETKFPHPRDVLRRPHTLANHPRYRGGVGACAASQAFQDPGRGGEGGRFFSEQLYCRSDQNPRWRSPRQLQCPDPWRPHGICAPAQGHDPARHPQDRGSLRRDPCHVQRRREPGRPSRLAARADAHGIRLERSTRPSHLPRCYGGGRKIRRIFRVGAPR